MEPKAHTPEMQIHHYQGYPAMLDFSPITIKDKELFTQRLTDYNPQASELNFTNLFMWRDYYRFLYCIHLDYLCIISVPDERPCFSFIPVRKYERESFFETINRLKEYFKKRKLPIRFSRIAENELSRFEELGIPAEQFTFEPDHSDYIYSSSDLICLDKSCLNYKRNLLRRFKQNNSYEYFTINAGNVDECIKINSDWFHNKGGGDSQLTFELVANSEVLKNYEVLGCSGALIKVNGKFEAFTYGDQLNSDTAVIHAEHANRNIPGLYNFINQKFCEMEWSRLPYINREQDLGLEGLRKAKISYNPLKRVRKHSITLN